VIYAVWSLADNKLFLCRNTTLRCGVAKAVVLIIFKDTIPTGYEKRRKLFLMRALKLRIL
jgi:hypothetical protein